jgi:peptide/nickel transport system substrate-binding protein
MSKTLWALPVFFFLLAASGQNPLVSAPDKEDLLVTPNVPGRQGGRLVASERVEPKTLNPVTFVDRPSRDVITQLNADLIHINRATQHTEPALAKSWTISKDGRVFILHLRQGLHFSDGHPFDADDATFSFQVYLDEKVHSPQRDLLTGNGQTLAVEKLDRYTIRVRLGKPDAAAERLFDSIAMLPRHLLEKSYQSGSISQTWNFTTPPDQIAGLGPFRMKEYVAGQQITLERNPYYWKIDSNGIRLPYLDSITFFVVASEDAEAIRFQAGDTDVINRVNAENYSMLEKEQSARGYRMQDLGPGLEYNFLLFNQNEDTAGRLPDIERKQRWFRELRFRQAVSVAIDRAAILRLAYRGRGTALAAHVTPGNKMWQNAKIAPSGQSQAKARDLLQSAGFTWSSEGKLLDPNHRPVEFSILASSSNTQRMQIANIIQQDLAQIGMEVRVVPLEFRAFVQRITQTHEYEAAVMGIVSGDADPNPDMNVWKSSGATHLWNMGEKKPATSWESEIDSLMEQQATTLDYRARKKLYDRLQEIVATQLPIICLASPNILVGGKSRIGNFRPAILDPYTLHNAEELFWSNPTGK